MTERPLDITVTFASDASLPEPICLRVAELRKRGTSDLRAHLSDPRNVHVCPAGRVFIDNGGAGSVFCYDASPWANPFKVGTGPGEYPLEVALDMYSEHLDRLLRDPSRRTEFEQLRDARTIGCTCLPGEPCHRDRILAALRGEPLALRIKLLDAAARDDALAAKRTRK